MAALTPRRCPRFISPSRLSSAAAVIPTPPQREKESRETIQLSPIPKTNCKRIHNDSDKPPSLTSDMLRRHIRNVYKVRDNLTNAVTYLGTIHVDLPNPGRYLPDYHRLLNSLSARKAVKPETTADTPTAKSIKSKVVQAENRKVVSKKKPKVDYTEQLPQRSVPFEEAMQQTHESVQSFYNNSANVVSFSGSTTTDDFKDVETADSEKKIKSKAEVESSEDLGFFEKFAKIIDNSGEKKPERIPVIRKDFVSRAALSHRTKSLVASLKTCSTDASLLVRTDELCKHLLDSPESRSIATKAGVLPLLLRLRNSADREVSGAAREALALVGYVDPVKGRGVRILTVDGGGTKGLVAIETMRQLEAACRRDITELFDLVFGVSTGSLILAMVFMFHVPLDRCERLYKQLSTQMFTRNRFVGTGKLMWSHAFYDTDIWENILRENLGEELMVRLARDPAVPKMACSSCLMNAPKLKNFIFRNYNLPPEVFSKHPGNCKQRVWEAIRASSAAPGYYEDFKIGDFFHQDGGVLSNNPSALAIHEGKLLWPQESIQCVISLGNGRHEPSLEISTGSKVTLKDKVNKIVDSATDTEAVHTTLQDLMAPSTYFRFNPYLSEDFMLDEIRPDKHECMQRDAQLYLRKNDLKIQRAAQALLQPRRPHQKAADWLKLTADKM